MASSTQAAEEYDRFFQTSDTLAATSRRAAKSGNTHGRPIRLSSKLSAVVIDPATLSDSFSSSSPAGSTFRVYVSGSDGCARRVKLGRTGEDVGKEDSKNESDSAGSVDLTLSGPKAPLTCLQAVPSGANGQVTVYAGCWDKRIYAWDIDGDKVKGQPRVFRDGHSDFVKCIAIHRARISTGEGSNKIQANILISGSADRSIVLWNGDSSTRLTQLRNFHKTSLNVIVVDPASALDSTGTTFSIISGSSDGEIFETEFAIKPTATSSSPFTVELTGRKSQIQAHPTTIYALSFFGDDLDLLTASADGTATIQKRNDERFEAWELDTTLKHEGHVRSVASESEGSKIFTGGRDENVKLWDAGTGKLVACFDGHFDEVTGMIVIEGGVGGTRAVSVSLDGTIRTWDQEEVERAKKAAEVQESGKSDDRTSEGKDKGGASMLTAEEEAELEALMDDSD